MTDLAQFKRKTDRGLKRLKNMEVFVLDNSIRETTIATLHAHTVENKKAIYREVKKAGFQHYLISSFNSEPRLGELFIQQMQYEGEDLSNAFAFSEMFETIKDGIPTDDIPIGMLKCKQYGIKNILLEVDFMYYKIDYEKFDMDKVCAYIKGQIDWVRQNLSKDSMIFINIRDFSNLMVYHPDRVWHFVNYMSSLAPNQRITGLAYEDLGKYPVGYLANWTRAVRNEMDRCGWEDGHFIVHIHEQWSTMHAENLACLAAGATGVWAGLCMDGAALGHADTCTLLMNLIRMGNTKVLQQFNCKYLREAAINTTIAATGHEPWKKQPIYGERAVDMLFGFIFAAKQGGDEAFCNGFDLCAFLGIERPIRISTMAAGEMIMMKLRRKFGYNEQFTKEMGNEMKIQIMENAAAGRKEEYNSNVGLAMLFAQAGGKLTPEMTAAIDAEKNTSLHIKSLIEEIKADWDEWDTKDGRKDDQITFDNFYNGFMGPYFGCYRCEDSQLALRALDMDADGQVDWKEFKFYLIWAGREYPQCKTKEDLLDKAFRYGLIPDMKDEIDKLRDSKQKPIR